MDKAIKVIEIELFDVKDQQILDKKVYKIELYEKYLKYDLEFKSYETDEEEIMRINEDTSDEFLRDLQLKEPPKKKVYRKELSYIDKNSIEQLDFSNTSENDFGILSISQSAGEDIRIFYRKQSEGIAVLEELRSWRWG